MTQTPSRDWQKEAKVYKQSYEATLTAYTAEKARADAAKKLLLDAIGCLMIHTSDDNSDVKRISQGVRTLYPDTPAPKEVK